MSTDRTPSELGPAYSWRDGSDGSWLQYHAGCAAYVRRAGEGGKFVVVIYWLKREIRGTAASIRQGKRFITRWIKARGTAKYRPRQKPAPTRKSWVPPELPRKSSPPRHATIAKRTTDFDLEAELPAIPVFEDFLAALEAQRRAAARDQGKLR